MICVGVEETLRLCVRSAVDNETWVVSFVGAALNGGFVDQAVEFEVSAGTDVALSADCVESLEAEPAGVACAETGADVALALVIVELPTWLEGRPRLDTRSNPLVVATAA